MKQTKFTPQLLVSLFFSLAATLSISLSSCSKNDAVSPESTSAAASKSSAIYATLPTSPAATVTTGLYHEQWTNVVGNDVVDIPLSVAANTTGYLTSLSIPENYTTNLGDRITAYIVAPTTGKYSFWISGDDAAQLWLSTDDTQAHAVQIASLLSWTNYEQWTEYASQKSAQISLVAGQKYFLQVLHKQGGGGNNLAVQWELPSGTIEAPIPGSRFVPCVPTSTPTYVTASAITLTNESNVTISGKAIAGGTVPSITLINCSNITITGNKLYNSTDVGIHLYECKNITVENNYFTNVSSGVYAEQTTAGGIVVENNQFLNMVGPYPRGQFVQFNNVDGPGSTISNNIGENILGQSNPEDAISLYQSSGTSASPITINNNEIRGGGPSSSGGGIMLGDNGGSYLSATGNILVNPGEYGMAIAGGDHNSIINNKIYGATQSFTNVGLYVNSIGGYTVTNATVSGNEVLFYNSTNYENNAWLAPGTNMPTGWNGNGWGASLSTSILPATLITDK